MRSFFRSATLAAIALGTLSLFAGIAEAAMVTKGASSQPIGHYEFCRTYSDQCSANPVIGIARMTDANWQTITSINTAVNAAIFPRTDMEIHGMPEVWSYPSAEGDCEDYALLKQYMLEKEGIPRSALLITVVRQPNGDGHAVLTVRTDAGDFVLDNLDDTVLNWRETPYHYLKRQSEAHAGQWVEINDDRDMLVGSIR